MSKVIGGVRRTPGTDYALAWVLASGGGVEVHSDGGRITRPEAQEFAVYLRRAAHDAEVMGAKDCSWQEPAPTIESLDDTPKMTGTFGPILLAPSGALDLADRLARLARA